MIIAGRGAGDLERGGDPAQGTPGRCSHPLVREGEVRPTDPDHMPIRLSANILHRQFGLGLSRLPHVGGFGRPDRKSTRLNSSHVRISYAVFCLKKKKKKQNNTSIKQKKKKNKKKK